MKAPYTALISPAERAAAVKAGAALSVLRAGVPLSAIDGAALVKFAQDATLDTLYGPFKLAPKALAALALLAGAPLGALTHHIDRKVSGETPEERERLNRIRYYRDLTTQLESGLPALPA